MTSGEGDDVREFGRAAPFLGSAARAPSRVVDYRPRKELLALQRKEAKETLEPVIRSEGQAMQASAQACGWPVEDTKLQTEE